LASDDRSKIETETLPFGAMDRPTDRPRRSRSEDGGPPELGIRPGRAGGVQPVVEGPGREGAQEGGEDGRSRRDWRKPHKRRGGARRGGRRRRKQREAQAGQPQAGAPAPTRDGRPEAPAAPAGIPREPRPAPAPQRVERQTGSGMFVLEKGGFGTLRSRESDTTRSGT
jgi:hypothetical protein